MHRTAEIRQEIRNKLEEALRRAIEDGLLPAVDTPPYVVERPRDKAHGDFAVNLALVLAGPARRSPREIAGTLEVIINENLERADTVIRHVETAGPGFLNFHLHPRWLYAVMTDIARQKGDYGRTGAGAGRSVLVEFVSANPTGPLNVANARAAAVGDVLANLLVAAGFQVSREFYVNDAGNQFRQLGVAMETRCRQLLGENVELPAGAYPGEYIIDLAREFLARHGRDPLDSPPDQRLRTLAAFAVDRLVAGQRAVLAGYGLEFDRWFSERALREAGGPERALETLAGRAATYESEGATWFRATAFGDEKDRVLVKQDGELTYLLADIAYHLDKLARGHGTLINLWGPDHHGYIARLKGALSAAGHPAETLEVLIIQWVRLLRDGEPVKMSKRGGEFVTMEELLEEVGTDAARFFFLMRSPDSHLDFDLNLARLQSNENPVFYVQYAHARIASILREAAERGITVSRPQATGRPPEAGPVPLPDLTRLRQPGELDLIRRLADFPEEIILAAEGREPHRLTAFLREVATLFHVFYADCRVLGEDPGLTEARLFLVWAVQMVLGNGLGLLGVSAPERM